MEALPGVTAVHDLHVWTVTSGIDAMSAHLVVEDMADARRVLDQATDTVRTTFGIGHTDDPDRGRRAPGRGRREPHLARVVTAP